MSTTPDIETWIAAGVEAGHAPDALLREMCRGGWDEMQALQLIESTLSRRLKEMNLPLSRDLIDQLPCFPHRSRQFLTSDECEYLLNFSESPAAEFGVLKGDKDYWAGRTLLPDAINDSKVTSALRRIHARVVTTTEQLLTRYVQNCPPLYADVINFARWPAGYALEPHADRENPDGSTHPYPWREFAAVIYLNTDFTGGEIYFPHLGITLTPEAGSLVIFPGSLRFLHGVTAVTRGVRHTLATFLTFDEEKEYLF
jgi:hypothetical protein